MARNSLVEKARNELLQAKKNPKNALLDTVRGGLLGATTDNLGYIPDAVADFMRPFGYNVPPQDVIGGTEWLANKFTTPTNSLAEKSARFATGMLTPSPMDFARLGKGPMQEMTVYHGSPHDFDKFDMSKIGTGEGAQAYGHGLYVAEKPGVAKSYQSKLSGGISGLLVDAETARKELSNRIAKASAKIGYGDPNRGSLPIAAAHVDRLLQDAAQDIYANKGSSKWPGMLPNAFKELKKFGVKTDDLFNENTGRLYTVDLPDSHIANMLDWDAPLSQQPESVRKALNFEVVKDPEFAQGLSDSPWLLNLNGQTINGYKTRKEALGAIADSTGAQLYATLAGGQGQPWASRKLAEFGIPGIKYLDGGSRAAGEGSRNYVVFDDKLLKILKKE